MKLFRSNGYCALPFLTLLSSPAFAASYSENMHLGEYIVGLAALALVVWDIARRYTQRASSESSTASGPAAAASGIVRQLCDAGIWGRIREVVLDHPFEASVLVCAFALLNFARVPFSLSAALVGTITYLSLVLGARLAAHPGARSATAAKPAVQPAAARPAIVARPAPRRPVLAAKPETAKPAVAEAAPAKASEAPAEAPAAPAETAAAPAEAKAEATPETKPAAPASRRRGGGTSASPSRPSRRRTTTKPKT